MVIDMPLIDTYIASHRVTSRHIASHRVTSRHIASASVAFTRLKRLSLPERPPTKMDPAGREATLIESSQSQRVPDAAAAQAGAAAPASSDAWLDDLVRLSQEDPPAPEDGAAAHSGEDACTDQQASAGAPPAQSEELALVPACMQLAPVMHAETPLQPVQEQHPSSTAETKVCNLCEGRFEISEGVRKGVKWFRCRNCCATVLRMEEAAKSKSDLAVKNLAALKRNHREYRAQVLKEQLDPARGPAAKRKIGCYLEDWSL